MARSALPMNDLLRRYSCGVDVQRRVMIDVSNEAAKTSSSSSTNASISTGGRSMRPVAAAQASPLPSPNTNIIPFHRIVCDAEWSSSVAFRTRARTTRAWEVLLERCIDIDMWKEDGTSGGGINNIPTLPNIIQIHGFTCFSMELSGGTADPSEDDACMGGQYIGQVGGGGVLWVYSVPLGRLYRRHGDAVLLR